MYKLNYFNFKENEKSFLITNDVGRYMFLNKQNFTNLVQKKDLENELKEELIHKGFIYEGNEEIFATNMSMDLRRSKEYLLVPTTLHIFVVSKNCNFNCVYCQAGNLNQQDNYNMSRETAKRAVDIAMESPSQYLTFEFQGGEPLINFEIIKYIVEYSKEISNGKFIEYNLVSNLTLLTDEMIDFFIENNVSICTSIDGNKEVQNINRAYKGNDSYEETVNQIKKIKERPIKINAIETTTKYSLNKYKEIIDEYINLGLESIFIRPLTQLGKADKNWVQLIKFFNARIATLGLEMLLTYIFITALGFNSDMWVIIWTLAIQVIVVISNYFLSKIFVFKDKKNKDVTDKKEKQK